MAMFKSILFKEEKCHYEGEGDIEQDYTGAKRKQLN